MTIPRRPAQALEDLLIDNVLVSGDENLKPFTHGERQQLTVAELAPTPLVCRLYLMWVEEIPERDRCSLIE